MRHKQNEILLDGYLEFLTYSRANSILTEAEIQQLLEDVTLDKLKNISKKSMKIIEKALRGVKVNINGLKQSAKRYSKTLEKDFKKGMTPEQASKRVTKDATVVITKEVKAMKAKASSSLAAMGTGEKIFVAIIMFMVLLYISTLLTTIAVAILHNPQLAEKLTIIIISPMLEEAAKSYFIENDMPWIGTGVTFGLELAYYMRAVVGGSLQIISKFLILRIASLLLHFSTTYIQKKIIESGEAAKKDRTFIAWMVGVGIHSSWNITMIVYNKEVAGWLKK